ncbi:MAG: DUF938 domain-containing protein [Alphaproteobacteria bacterium]|jgi:hypothetical protein|nr:DUF938 domain-containing protein [Alphaproteobacteria bacterium]
MSGNDEHGKTGNTATPYWEWTGEVVRGPVKHFSPSAERNIDPIAEVLRWVLPAHGRVLEIASGTGQHAVAFAQGFPDLDWQPSDTAPEAHASIAAWRAEAGLPNLAAALDLDVSGPIWERGLTPSWGGIVAINLLHITPWRVTEGLLRGAGALLSPGAPLVVYGCFKRQGRHLSTGNATFDDRLRRHDPEWGVRDVDAVAAAAEPHGLVLDDLVEMPSANLTLVWKKRPE